MKIKINIENTALDELTVGDMFILENNKDHIFIKASNYECINVVALENYSSISAHIAKDTIVRQIHITEMNIEIE